MSYIEATDTSLRKTGQIKLHGASGFVGMRKAGALVAKCLDELTDIVKAGVPTSEIDEFVRNYAFSHGAYPATLMYAIRPAPRSITWSAMACRATAP
jgi:methionyl aminopeptidase